MKGFNIDGPGDFLHQAGEQSRSQDFTFNNAPLLELTDLPTSLEIFTLRERCFHDPELLKMKLLNRADNDLQLAPAGLPNQHSVSYVQYSQSAYRYGEYIAKYALFPTAKYQQHLAESAKINRGSSPEQHSEWLHGFFTSQDAEFDFRI